MIVMIGYASSNCHYSKSLYVSLCQYPSDNVFFVKYFCINSTFQSDEANFTRIGGDALDLFLVTNLRIFTGGLDVMSIPIALAID